MLYSPAAVLVAWGVAIAVFGTALDAVFFVALLVSIAVHVREERRFYKEAKGR